MAFSNAKQAKLITGSQDGYLVNWDVPKNTINCYFYLNTVIASVDYEKSLSRFAACGTQDSKI